MITQRRNRLPCSGLLFAFLLAPGMPAAADEPLDRFDEYVQAAMNHWEVPGLAVVIIRDGQVVYRRGHGVRRLGEHEPVTPRTLFPIASCTKGFTAAAIGLLVDDEKLRWDDPVRKHLPDFELHDPYLTREVTIRDLLAHRVGLELGNTLWSKSEFTPDEIMRRLRHLKPQYGFRSRFCYNNLMYLAAGRVVEKTTGKSWGEFVSSRILRPVRMRSTTTSFPEEADVAWPHAELEGRVTPLRLERTYNESIAPAGAIWSNANDMANWVRLNLARGRLGQHRVIQAGTLAEMHSPQTIIPAAGAGTTYPKQDFRSYGIGWFVEDYRGRMVVRHSGSRNGFVAWVAMLPDKRLGFVVLANVHRTGLNFALHHRILDAYLGLPPKDWSAIVKDDYSASWQKSLREAKAAYDKRRRLGTKPDLELARYAGTFRSDLYGDLTILHKGNALELRFGPRRMARLQHWQDNTFRAVFANPMLEPWHVTFKVQQARSVESLHAVAAPWALAWYEDSTDLGVFGRVASSP